MSVILGWASQSEHGTVNGTKGDQTGREVKTGNYYSFKQNQIIRFRNSVRGKKAAKAMKLLCANNNIGYGQKDRVTLYTQCKKIGWKINKIGNIGKCNADCSELCVCAINLAYGKAVLPNTVCTSTFYNYTVKKHPKCFKCLTSSTYINGNKLKAGDMPLKAGRHIAMVVSA